VAATPVTILGVAAGGALVAAIGVAIMGGLGIWLYVRF
jgi:hypothetical protein